MSERIIDSITYYLKFQSRNKIIFHCHDNLDLVTVNVGLHLSEAIYNFNEQKKFSLKVKAEVDKIMNKAMSNSEIYGSYLSIENVGILFEPELKLDFLRLLDSYSQNNVLFVKWEGEIDSSNLFFLTKENGLKINIKNLSHIAV